MRAVVFSMRDLFGGLGWVTGLRIAFLVSLFVFVFFFVIKGLILDWWTHAEYSHGFIIPFISAYLIWRSRKELQECPKTQSLIGFAFFLLSLGVFLLGWVGQEEFVQRLSLPLTLLGLVLFLAGKNAFAMVLFPIGYLFLMIPIPYTFYKPLSLKLRLLDADLTTLWSSSLGVPIFQEGYLLHLPYITLEVADACSGVLSIIALLALGIFYVHLLQLRSWKRLILWTLLIPVSILANVVRIVTIVVIVHYSGNWILDTTFHQFNGTFNFLLGFMAIVFAGYLVDRIPTGNRSAV